MQLNEAGLDIIHRYTNPRNDGEYVEMLRHIKKAQSTVRRGIRPNINDNEYSALVSFVVGMGSDGFFRSHVRTLCNRRDWFGAAQEIRRTAKTPADAVRRREEAGLFLLSALVSNREEAS